MPIQLRVSDNDPYVYLEPAASGSVAVGTDDLDSNKLKIVMSDAVSDLDPGSGTIAAGTCSLSIDPTANGDIEFCPKGSGQSTFARGSVAIEAQAATAGNLLMEDTNAGGVAGVIEMGGDRFIHKFGTRNTFVGENAGNFSLTPANSVSNTAIGFNALNDVGGVGGAGNTVIGANSGNVITTGNENTAVGRDTLNNVTTGNTNTAIGNAALDDISTGSNNTAIGANAGASLTGSDSNNILIGNGVTGTAGNNRILRIGQVSGGTSIQQCFIAGINGASNTPSGVVGVDSLGKLAGSNGGNGQVQIGGGSGPVWANITSTGSSLTVSNGVNTINMEITAPVSVANGGTGATSLTDHGVLVGSGTAAVTPLAVGTNGQVLLGSTGADPVFATLTSTGGTITYTTGAGTLNLDTTAQPGITWSEVTGTTQAAAANGGYIANNAGTVTITLLAAASAGIGTKLRVTGINNATGWVIAQNASQQIFFGTSSTTAGVGGSLASTATRDSVELVCVSANGLNWNVLSSVGNITVT